MMDHVKFIQMKDGDKEDYEFLKSHEIKYTEGTADHLLSTLIDLEKSISVYQVNRLGHSVQSATRVWWDGLILIGLYQLFCTILAIFLRLIITMNMPRQSCVPLSGSNANGSLKKHIYFLMSYYAQHVGVSPNKRELSKDCPYHHDYVTLCERCDQTSHDPDYVSKPLEISQTWCARSLTKRLTILRKFDLDCAKP